LQGFLKLYPALSESKGCVLSFMPRPSHTRSYPEGDPSLAGAAALEALGHAVRQRIEAGEVDVPLLPQVASQVLSLAIDPKADAARLSALIHKDPSLAGRVLQIANSPAYMPKMPIVSLQQAVARLGLDTVVEIAFVASLDGGTFEVPGYEDELENLWRHAIASGAFAKEIARIKRVNVESAFLCGLLHAVGKPALLQVVADAEAELEKKSGYEGALRGAALAVLDQFHVGIGAKIAEAWRLPVQVTTAIVFHADYAAAPSCKIDAMIAGLADAFATDLVRSRAGGGAVAGEAEGAAREARLRELPVVADLNLYPSDLDGLLAKRASVSQIVESMMA
jgi:putative nucleotidyltransferase with HDIG domain